MFHVNPLPMKYHSLKNNEKYSRLSSAEVVIGALRVKKNLTPKIFTVIIVKQDSLVLQCINASKRYGQNIVSIRIFNSFAHRRRVLALLSAIGLNKLLKPPCY